MLTNNLDPEVAERPEDLVVYGGIGKAARNWECYDAIVAALKVLEADQTLLIQSGKPVGVFRTHEDAPRVLLANSNLVPHWATWEHFNELDRKGLMMYGQMTAGSWIYIGSQGIVQGTYETFVEMGRQHFGGDLRGRWILTAGLGGMGGAQPLAATMAGASMLAIECQESRIEKRLDERLSRSARAQLEEALRYLDASLSAAASRCRWHCAGTRRRYCRNWCVAACVPMRSPIRPRRTIRSTAICRSAGRWSSGRSCAVPIRRASPPRPVTPWCRMCEPCSNSSAWGCRRLITAITYARSRSMRASRTPSRFPGFVPAYIRPLFCRGIGPFRWAALSGDPRGHRRTDAKVKQLMPDDPHLHHWLDMAQQRIQFQGLPARICWVGLGERHRLGLAFNEMVACGELKAPIVIGRDHLDSGSVASPNRETESHA